MLSVTSYSSSLLLIKAELLINSISLSFLSPDFKFVLSEIINIAVDLVNNGIESPELINNYILLLFEFELSMIERYLFEGDGSF